MYSSRPNQGRSSSRGARSAGTSQLAWRLNHEGTSAQCTPYPMASAISTAGGVITAFRTMLPPSSLISPRSMWPI
ncbi:hypothetical protein SBADM41S_02005 [Streptomyces badius]